MDKKNFERIFQSLPEKRKRVLLEFLKNRNTQEVANSLNIQCATVNVHIRNICIDFGLKSDGDDDKRSARPELIKLFEQYKPELFKQDDDFIGRKNAITHLDQLRQAGKNCVLIQGDGGVGKTVLAERYLAERFPGRLVRFDVAKERQAVGSAAGLLETKLKDLGEESRGDFAVLCDRLRHKLQSEAFGILVDNLEPALDGKGQLVPEHREYVELLRVLSNVSLKSFTLITSRERVNENLNIEPYRLECLDMEAWRDYFGQKKLTIDSPVLAEMRKSYRGNALGMKVLRGRIAENYQGNIKKYWEEHQTSDGLAVEQAMENLITQQFDRLKQVNPNAYNLLCRMGCFRYQDVPTVPREGLFCLLWEVPQNKAQKAIDTLRNLALVDHIDGEYRLHPLIKEQAIERLRNSEDWKTSNRLAAKFWTDSVESINTEEDAITALEAYYHCLNIKDFNSAADIITNNRRHIYDLDESLGSSFYRLGLLLKIKQVINAIKNQVSSSLSLGQMYNVLGDTYWMMGNLQSSLLSHIESAKIAKQIIDEQHKESQNKELNRLYGVSFFNQALCKVELLEFKEAIELLRLDCKRFEDMFPEDRFVDRSFMAFCYSSLNNKKQAEILLKKSINLFENLRSRLDTNQNNLYVYSSTWSFGYHHIFSGKIYHKLGKIDNAKMQYSAAISFANKTSYLQVKAKGLMGLGEIYTQSDFKTALSYHTESIDILKRIDAKCDLAEAYYQIALTYQAMGDVLNSQEYFKKSITLWQKIDAPRQIERVQNSMNQNIHKKNPEPVHPKT
ncbi:AAA family ATPase [Spirulina major]|uniref:AAA family ATPase n=1 Tax=Spirulina major TaxID=270636 RepID=UPI000932490E|nr:AAA family ATPase [Spirulina major]